MPAEGGARAIPRADRRRLDDLTHEIETLREGDVRVLGRVLPSIARLVSAETACTYALTPTDGGFSVDFAEAHGARPEASARVTRWFERASGTAWAHYDPLRPERAQRNVALTLSDLEAMTTRPFARLPIVSMIERAGLLRRDQLRVVVCGGPVMLAWVGAYRDERFGARERGLLDALARPLRSRARLDRLLARGTFHRRALDAALEVVGAAAFITASSGAVLYANSAGRALLEADTNGTLGEIRESIRRGAPGYGVTRIASPGVPDSFLAVRRSLPTDVDARLPVVATRWGLTRRQTDVLALVARGVANKTIAGALRCSVGTVEYHVTALLEKCGAESRAELVARFWTT